MSDTKGSEAQEALHQAGWLLLITEVPSRPDYLRVKLRRRVQRLGAIGLKGAVYVLPDIPDATESFQWLRREILADGGEATLVAARFVDGMSDEQLMGMFNADRDAEYREFMLACSELEKRWLAAKTAGDEGRATLSAERERLRRKLEEVLGRDYFTSASQEDAMQAIEKVAVLDIALPATTGKPDTRTNFSGRVWATRAGVKVDRISSAWLIRREIDPDAKFFFVAEGKLVPKGSVRFDMYEGEFTHDGARCTFEVLLDHFGVTDPALRIIGQMVHDIDMHEDPFGRPETAGFAAMIDGIVSRFESDDERLREGGKVLDLFAAGLNADRR